MTETIPTPATQSVDKPDSVLQQQMAEAEELTNELKRLLVRHESALEHEGIRHQIETLERWMETYRHGLSAARKISENGACWLNDVRQTLKLAAEELQRLEGEGGNPATKEQIQQAEDFLKASSKIDSVIPNLEQIFSPREAMSEDKEKVEETAL